jgi:hypothetical protein
MRFTEFNKQIILEGGNAIENSTPVPKDKVPEVVAKAKSLLPKPLLNNLQADIGSAGYKEIPAGDIDLMIDAADLVEVYQTGNDKNPVLAAKKKLEAQLKQAGYEANMVGRNVHVGIPFAGGLAQVDYMIIQDAAIVAPYHQHGPRGMYADPEFVGSAIFQLIASIAKHLGLTFDAFGATLKRRDNGEVIARDRDAVAKILINKSASGDDLNSVKTLLAALKNDPERDAKLAQARADVDAGKMTLPGDIRENVNPWIFHDNFKKEKWVELKGKKFKLVAQGVDDNGLKKLLVYAYPEDANKFDMFDEAGRARFLVTKPDRKNPGTWHLSSSFTHVSEKFRRMGVGSAMYNFAQELGNDVLGSDSQSDDAKAFWAARQGKPKQAAQ